jgi:tetratricopeptide (TPR) repeat protein
MAWTYRGVVLNELGRYDEAIHSFDKALALQPEYTIAMYYRGNSLGRLGKYTEAVAMYDQAIAITPDFSNAVNNRKLALEGKCPDIQIVTGTQQGLTGGASAGSSTGSSKTNSAPLRYAPVGVLLVVVGYAAWSRRRDLL